MKKEKKKADGQRDLASGNDLFHKERESVREGALAPEDSPAEDLATCPPLASETPSIYPYTYHPHPQSPPVFCERSSSESHYLQERVQR